VFVASKEVDMQAILPSRRLARRIESRQAGLTLLELIIACTLLLILASAAVPLVRITIVRSREAELRRSLREIRNAIDRYKDMADALAFQTEVGSNGYPPDLDTLVKGVTISGNRKVRFLRRIPVDPMTGKREWGMRSVQDDPDSTSWGGNNVFDVFSTSQGTALDGTKYSDW
jgi:general secretion pathway protein G